MTIFIFDGSFEGLLTSVFEYYERKPGRIQLVPQKEYHPVLLDAVFEVISNEAKARRVWSGLKKRISHDWQTRFYKSYLSEDAATFRHLFEFACYVFDNPDGVAQNYGHPAVMAISKMDKSVNREKHRMKAFIRFRETADGIFYAAVEPDYNVLPLIITFFKNRYADQKWIIYDLRRHYGLYYDLDKVEAITMEHQPEIRLASAKSDLLHGKEQLYALLWNDYFRSTNIPARKNMKLHIQHVPKRYWKFLTEKQ
jgi:probable DNA metabolism protein